MCVVCVCGAAAAGAAQAQAQQSAGVLLRPGMLYSSTDAHPSAGALAGRAVRMMACAAAAVA
jgi:hypothetical protein